MSSFAKPPIGKRMLRFMTKPSASYFDIVAVMLFVAVHDVTGSWWSLLVLVPLAALATALEGASR